MSFLRFFYKSWNVFWNVIAITILVLVCLAGILFGLLQLEVSKNYLATQIQVSFNEQFVGVMSIHKLKGVVPFQMEIQDVNIYADSSSIDTVFFAQNISAGIQFRSLFKKRIVLNALNISSPKVTFDNPDNFSIISALKKRDLAQLSTEDEVDASENAASFFEILAPNVSITQGELVYRNLFRNQESLGDVKDLRIENIDATMFVEYNQEQRFIDFDSFLMSIPNLNVERAQLFGQIYNDANNIEFNAFNVIMDGLSVNLNGIAEGIDVFEGEILEQLSSSKLRFNLEQLTINQKRLKQFYPEAPFFQKDLVASVSAEGSIDDLQIENLNLYYGNSGIYGYGEILNANDFKRLQYQLTLENSILESEDVIEWFPNISPKQLSAFTNLAFSSEFEGNLVKVEGKIEANSPRGSLKLEGIAGIGKQKALKFDFETDSLNISNLVNADIYASSITSKGSFETDNFNYEVAEGDFFIQVQNSFINQLSFDELALKASFSNSAIFPNINFKKNNSLFEASGMVAIVGDDFQTQLIGSGEDFNLKEVSNIKSLASVTNTFNFEMDVQGKSVDDFLGYLSFDVSKAITDSDTLEPHQLYADFIINDLKQKEIRITTSSADLSIVGNFKLTELQRLAPYWTAFFENRIKEEVLLSKEFERLPSRIITSNQVIEVEARTKNIALIKSYLPNFPINSSNSTFSASINVDGDRILFNSDFFDPELRLLGYEVDSLEARVTGSFRFNQKFKDFAGVEIRSNIKSINSTLVDAKDVQTNISINQNQVSVIQQINRLGKNAYLNSKSKGIFSDSTFVLNLEELDLGSEAYLWQNRDTAKVTYFDDSTLSLENFFFENDNQIVSINGVFSNEIEDSVNYAIENLDLDRISQIINGRINFGGELNGRFTTRTLTQVPTIAGEIDLKRFSLNNRTVGDVELRSALNSELNRFDTKLTILTDPKIYPQYFKNVDNVGQDMVIEGYVLAPIDGNFPDRDSLYVFDLDFKSVDLWFVPILAPNVFTELTGKATGEGKLWGNLEDWDFDVDFDLGSENTVYMKPNFLDTHYYGQGFTSFSKSNGLVFENVSIIDPSGGIASLTGYYNFNNFSPRHSMDIRIEADQFQFLNNTFSPTVPFFGIGYGTGTVRLSGSNINPVITTLSPLRISDFSEIGLPLLEETEFNEDNNFIRFVNDFDDYFKKSSNSENGTALDPEQLQNRTFAERFTLDLQFVANNPMTVRLIFDPVTGDIISTRGTGRLQIRLQNEELSLFGRFNVESGSYNFVSGDIFSRRFNLEPGGFLTWDGPANNARVNIDAVYSARPNIRTLTTARADIVNENAQRVPVDLVLNIRGNLTSVENDFFFRLPSNFETTQNNTLQAQISNLNRNEELKLLQATSFLLMGDFIPVSSTNTSSANTFSDNFSGSAAVLNPLLSNQLINPLLSNQVNSLLRSDLSSFDIDFNLNTYNQVDLGVALRLYNDKIILRRDGQVTGVQKTIGDIGATYRINRTLSVTAFHRQDPTFSNFTEAQETQQSQDINGLGVEAKFSFNTWKEFFNRIMSPFKRLFKSSEEEIEDENPI